MPSVVSVAQYCERTGTTEADLSGTDAIRVPALLRDATALVELHARPVTFDDAYLDDDGYIDETIPSNPYLGLIPVICRMVKRSVDNPNGFSQESIGDYSYSSFGDVVASKKEVDLIKQIMNTPTSSSHELDSYMPMGVFPDTTLLGEL